jgi:hypothetical protein
MFKNSNPIITTTNTNNLALNYINGNGSSRLLNQNEPVNANDLSCAKLPKCKESGTIVSGQLVSNPGKNVNFRSSQVFPETGQTSGLKRDESFFVRFYDCESGSSQF